MGGFELTVLVYLIGCYYDVLHTKQCNRSQWYMGQSHVDDNGMIGDTRLGVISSTLELILCNAGGRWGYRSVSTTNMYQTYGEIRNETSRSLKLSIDTIVDLHSEVGRTLYLCVYTG